MVRVLVAAVVALLISVGLGPRFIRFLRAREYGQHIREEGPRGHAVKQGTPTMGGLLFMAAMAVSFLAVCNYTTNALTVFAIAMGCSLIGFVDDFTKLTQRRSLGLSGRWKLVLMALITVGVAFVTHRRNYDTAVYVPIVNGKVPLSYAWYLLLFVIIAGAANGANLADGVDGLAAGTGIIAVFTYTAMAVIAWIRSGAPGHRSSLDLDFAILGAALIGALIGFLWYNAWPAEIFMGDTGSMGIGGALAGFAIMTKTELLLILIGGIYVIEALSVMIQVFSFKRFGKRVFLIAPIHHHFEMKAWSETKITVRFWIVGGIFCALAFALYYRYYFRFFLS